MVYLMTKSGAQHHQHQMVWMKGWK